jgi:streptogramin lyase
VIIPDVGTSVFSPKMIQCDDGTVWLMVSGALWRVKGDVSEVAKVIAASEARRMASFCLDASGTLWIVEQPTRGHTKLT